MTGMIKKLLAHCAIIISGMYIVFFLIDRVNPAMGFIDNDITKPLLLALALIAIINAIQVIAAERKKQLRKLRKSKTAGRR